MRKVKDDAFPRGRHRLLIREIMDKQTSRQSPRRSKYITLADILTCYCYPTRKTRVIYTVNMGAMVAKTFLAVLVDRGLLEEVKVEETKTTRGPMKSTSDKRIVSTYLTTEKGIRWRDMVWTLYDMLGGDII